MAMTPNTWYTITISAPANPLWTPGQYELAPAVLDAVAGSTTIDVFCLSDAGIGGAASFAFIGGTTSVPSGAVTISATPTMNTQTMDNGETWYSMRRPDGTWLFYGDQSGVVRSLAVPTTLGAFIS